MIFSLFFSNLALCGSFVGRYFYLLVLFISFNDVKALRIACIIRVFLRLRYRRPYSKTILKPVKKAGVFLLTGKFRGETRTPTYIRTVCAGRYFRI